MLNHRKTTCSLTGKYSKSANSVIFSFILKRQRLQFYSNFLLCNLPSILWSMCPSVIMKVFFLSLWLPGKYLEGKDHVSYFVSCLVLTWSCNMLDEKHHGRGMNERVILTSESDMFKYLVGHTLTYDLRQITSYF